MADFCNCDLHGVCGEYNSSRFSASELLHHKKWDELYDSSIGEFRRNITVCYCDAGWTGYSDLGTIYTEALQNCAIGQDSMTVLWTISLICHTIIVISIIQRVLEQREVNKGIRAKTRLFVRFVGTIAFDGLAIAKLLHISEPWLVTIGISPGITVVYLLAMLCFMLDLTDTQHRQVHMFYSKLFKDFGLGERIKVEQVTFVRSVRIQQACIVFSVILLGAAVNIGSKTARIVAVLVFIGVLFVILVFDVLIIDPKTNARFMNILKHTINVNATNHRLQDKERSKDQNSPSGTVRMNSTSAKENVRMQEVYTQIAVINRTKRIQVVLYALSSIPFYNRNWWKYLAYNVVLSNILSSFAKTVLYLLSLRRRSRRRRKNLTNTVLTKDMRSSEVSAFKSTTASVAPLVSE